MTLPGAAAVAFEKIKSRSLCSSSFLDSIAISTDQKHSRLHFVRWTFGCETSLHNFFLLYHEPLGADPNFLFSRLERMVSNGDETENEKAEQQPVGASPQHQQHQVGKSEAHSKPGSNGWGTCAELLLVSAVRKHGPLNWKLVALELKARALLLNTSPSCFSEEACRGKYNVLKGKFASTSNMGDAVGFDGGVLVEELRKLRMSDLKQELQQYDSSIRHLQSKIRKMKDDRTQLKTHSNVKQQGGESTKAQKAFESKPPVARKLDGPSDRAAGSIEGKSHAQPEPLLEARTSPPYEIADRSQIPEDGNPKGTEVQPPSTSKMGVKDLNDELQHAGESSSLRKSAPGQNHEHGKPRSVVRGEGEFRVPSARDQEQGRDSLEKKNRPPVNVRPHQVSRTASGKGEKDKEKVRNRMTSFDTSEQADVAVLAHDVSPSPRAETEDFPAANQVADGKESQKMADVKTPVEGRSRIDLPREVGRSSDSAEAVLRQQEADGTAAESGVKKDGVSQKPPTISYGRSVTKNRSKLSDDGRTSAHESRFVSGSASKSQQQVGELQNERSKLLSKVPTPSAEQMVDKGKAVGPFEDIVTGSAKGGSESAVIKSDSQEAEDKLVELKDLSDLRKHSVSKTMESKDGKEGKKASGQNKSAGSSREGSDNRKLTNSSKALGPKGGTEEKKHIDNRTLGAAEAAGDEKKHSSMNKRTGNNNNNPSREISGDKKFECGSSSSSKVVETSRDIADGKKTMSINKLVNMDLSKDKKLGSSSSSKTSELRDVCDAKKSMGSDALPDGERRDGRNIQSPNISPTPSASGGGDAFPEARRPDGSRARKRSESPQVNFPEGVAAEENRSPHLLQGISTEQKAAASNTDASQKQKRLESGKAVASSERERKRKAAALKPSPSGVTPEGRPAKRQWEEKPKTTANMDTNFNLKERKLGTKPKKIIDDEVSDLVYRRESGDLQEESRDFLESGERHVDYDNSETTERIEVASSMDSIEDTSPSGRKSKKEPKIPGKFLPLLECLRVICAHKSAPLFRQRQEYQEKRSYNLLVRRHVDLGMIRSRLEEGAYSSSVEFFRDLLLVFTNALVYNSKDSQEYSGAKVLRSYALAEMDKILQTEALLKQHGPATRKREVRKSKEVPPNRGGSTGSAGTEVRKKATGKPSGEGADAEVAQQRTGSVENSQRVDGDEEEREVEGGSETIKKPTPNRVMKEENQRREAPKAPMTPKIELNTEGNKNSSQSKSKNLKTDSTAQPPKSLRESEAVRPSQSGHVDNLESTSVELPSRLKDMTSVEEGGGQKLSGGIHSRPPQPAKHASASRSGTSTARGSRYSKRAGESSASNSKKRSRK
ncbi:hypothetical protein R1sor_002231 [Riccia sorocarpa]|uniref:Bromo domain-containing protein n=1 Tax=Riccia sorocarpa TaxID=122646 RepID=A0ABD3H0W8_9MARC